MTGGARCTVSAECQMVLVYECYSTMRLCVAGLNGRESSHQIMLQPQSHTHTYTNSRTCSLAKPTSLNPPCTSPSVFSSRWAGLQAAPSLDEAEWEVPHHWLMPTSKILLLPWLQGELPKCVSVYLVVLMEPLAPTVLCWKRKKKKKNPPFDGSRGCSVAAPKSLSAEACK